MSEEKQTLLIADDNEGLATLICKRLRSAGYDTEVKTNGVATIQYIQTSPPDLLLLDFRLPDMTGQQVIAALNETGCLVPFIVVTGAGDEATAVEMMKLGAQDYLRKDLDFLDRISGAVERVLAQIKIERQLIQAQLALQESEKRFRDFVYSMDDVVYETDADLRITYCSEQIIDVLGYSPEEIVGSNPFDFLENEDRQQIIELAHAGFVDHMPMKDFEGWYIKKDKKRVCLLTNGVPIFDAQGNFCGIRGASKDITNRKMAEIALSHNEAKYRSLVMNSGSGIVLLDEQGTILEWNPAQEKMTGFKAKEVCGQKMWEVQYLLTPDEKKTPAQYSYLQNYFNGLLQSGNQRPVYIQAIGEIQCKNDTRRTLETTIFSLPVKKGVMLSSISNDITQRKQAEDDLHKENARLKQQILEIETEIGRIKTGQAGISDERYSYLADNGAEMRASLTKIVNSVNTMMTGVFGAMSEEQVKTMKDIEKSSKRLTRLINGILDKTNH